MVDPGYRHVSIDHIGYDPKSPEFFHRLTEALRQLAETANSLRDGKINTRGEITLRASQTTTTLTDTRIGPNSFIALFPLTANAAGKVATTYVSARATTEGQATITHASSADADQDFMYVILG